MAEPAVVRTAITDLYGIRLPIIAGGLQWLANADYVAACGSAGIIGFITSASFPDTATLRDEIRRCRDLSGGAPFGVNVSMLPKLVEGERTVEVFETIIQEGVRFVETSGRSPEAYLAMLKTAGIKVLHKVPAVRYARKAASLGVDAVALVGAECGGHPGLEMIGSFVQGRMAADLGVPYVIGGGVGTGAQIAAALALGADGVLVGTRFLAADEIWAHEGFKQRLIESEAHETDLILFSLRNTMRVLRNDTSQTVRQIEARGEGSLETLLPHVSGKVGRMAYETGDWTRGALSVGQAVAFVEKRQPLAEIVRELEDELRATLSRLAATIPT